jgi:hypothetical protein
LPKASNAIATLLATWAFGITPPDMKKLANVSAIMVGVIIASYGEIQFVMIGFLSKTRNKLPVLVPH